MGAVHLTRGERPPLRPWWGAPTVYGYRFSCGPGSRARFQQAPISGGRLDLIVAGLVTAAAGMGTLVRAVGLAVQGLRTAPERRGAGEGSATGFPGGCPVPGLVPRGGRRWLRPRPCGHRGGSDYRF